MTQIKTGQVSSYIEQELAKLDRDLIIYNILPCPVGSLMGDAQEIKAELERTYTASVASEKWLIEPASFESGISKTTQLVSYMV